LGRKMSLKSTGNPWCRFVTSRSTASLFWIPWLPSLLRADGIQGFVRFAVLTAALSFVQIRLSDKVLSCFDLAFVARM
jgi:hypothetical protein